jgi:hypothetical protein
MNEDDVFAYMHTGKSMRPEKTEAAGEDEDDLIYLSETT